MHSCDNPPCVNPSHLSVGTSSDNHLDAAAKGRIPGNRTTDRAHLRRVDDDRVRQLRAQGLTFQEIGDQLRVARTTAWRALRR